MSESAGQSIGKSIAISICVCTSGRPDELRHCLDSIAAGTRRPLETLVSDDSRDPATAADVREICGLHEGVRYMEGPRRGLCANRNRVIEAAVGTHVSLLDDDATVGPDFVEQAARLAAARPEAILTGDVFERRLHRQPPTNPTFLGYFGRPRRPGEPLRNLNLNCNLLPRAVFEQIGFDESIAYGYEDTDLCARMIAGGHRIEYHSELLNAHLPPGGKKTPTSERRWQAERARFRTTLRRYLWWDRNLPAAAAFAAVAPAHLAVQAVRSGCPRHAASGWVWLAGDLLGLLRSRRGPRLGG